MQQRRIHESHGLAVFAVILEEGDEVMACLQRFAEGERTAAAQIAAIGAFARARLAFWDVEAREYVPHEVAEQTEVLSLAGDIAADEKGAPKLHLHAVLGRRDTSTRGGHLLAGWVRPTLEVIVTEAPAHLRRVHDPRLGLAVIRP